MARRALLDKEAKSAALLLSILVIQEIAGVNGD